MRFKIVLLIILASIGFFNPFGILSEQVIKLIFYLSMLGGAAVCVLDGESLKGVKYPRLPMLIVIGGIIFSAFMATSLHMQSLKVSLMTILPYVMAYSFFFILMKLEVPKEKIMNAYLVLCGISCIVYFCNVFTMPNNMFGAPIIGEDTSRGIIRIPVVFIEFFPMMVFYAINKWLIDKEKKWLAVIAIGLLMIVLSVIRQIILLTVVLGLFFFLRNVSWKIKIAMAAAMVAIVVFVLPMIPMYRTMVELSEQQKEENDDEENIRITAWRYYTYENQSSALSPIFGNGMPSFGNSRWGQQFETETDENGCLFVDVGWAGFFWVFGGVATLALIIVLYKALIKKKTNDEQYLNYWLIFLIITSVASGPIIIYWQIIDISVCLYLVFKKNTDANMDVQPAEVETDNKNVGFRVKGYPQLRKN